MANSNQIIANAVTETKAKGAPKSKCWLASLPRRCRASMAINTVSRSTILSEWFW